MKKILVITSLFLLLTACAADPLSNIPTNQRISLMAEKQQADHVKTDVSPLTVHEMLEKVSNKKSTSKKSKKSKAPTYADYYLTLQFTTLQKELSNAQKQQITNTIEKLYNPKKYFVQIMAGPSNSSSSAQQNFQAGYASQKRLSTLRKTLIDTVSDVRVIYEPNQNIGLVYLEFLAVADSKSNKKKANG